MSEIFSLSASHTFHQFSVTHWIVLIVVVSINFLIYLFRNRLKVSRWSGAIRIMIAVLLLLSAFSIQTWDIVEEIWSVAESLPFHLCGISLFLCPLMLITRNYRLYEVAYFWGLGGASQALLTPTISYGFPHLIFFEFFIAHALIVTSCLWATFIDGLRPTLRSIWRTFIVTNAYMVLIAVFNYITSSNYLFICHKPETASLLDYLGPWPWYIISLELVALCIFFLCYSPFLISDILSKRKRSHR